MRQQLGEYSPAALLVDGTGNSPHTDAAETRRLERLGGNPPQPQTHFWRKA